MADFNLKKKNRVVYLLVITYYSGDDCNNFCRFSEGVNDDESP